jgi:isoquinoline 1-oxidoreductase beta subunit
MTRSTISIGPHLTRSCPGLWTRTAGPSPGPRASRALPSWKAWFTPAARQEQSRSDQRRRRRQSALLDSQYSGGLSCCTETGIPVGFWRSVGNSQNGFFSESFMDELAAEAKKDPVRIPPAHARTKPRATSAFWSLAAQKAGWDKPLPAGRYRGIAVLFAFESYAAQVVEISVDRKARTLKVHRVVCAVDVGRVVNPTNIVSAERERGRVRTCRRRCTARSPFRGRTRRRKPTSTTIRSCVSTLCPPSKCYIVPSEEKPTGAGELSVPPVVPALCNAIFAATGRRVRRLPIRAQDLA